jgi:hypothetical protein
LLPLQDACLPHRDGVLLPLSAPRVPCVETSP